MRFTGNTTRILRRRCFHLASVIALGACAAKGPALVNPGASTAPAPNAPLSRETPAATPVWERSAELARYRRLTALPFVSQGHFDGRWVADVLANDLAAPEYTKLPAATSFPQGSVLVQTHAERRDGEPGPVFAMVKREPGYYPAGGDWEYVVTRPDGRVEDRGQLTLCARCHADGVFGWVFGLAPSSESDASTP